MLRRSHNRDGIRESGRALFSSFSGICGSVRLCPRSWRPSTWINIRSSSSRARAQRRSGHSREQR
jgi:hypothetical protein